MKEIENPIIYNEDLNVNDIREPEVIGKCEHCREDIIDLHEYIKLDSGELFCEECCLINYLMDNNIIERFNY